MSKVSDQSLIANFKVLVIFSVSWHRNNCRKFPSLFELFFRKSFHRAYQLETPISQSRTTKKNYAVWSWNLSLFLFNGCLSAWWSKCIKLKSWSFTNFILKRLLCLDRSDGGGYELLNIISQMKRGDLTESREWIEGLEK